jgi:drug/metabolite transporter (DMT)-like permease
VRNVMRDAYFTHHASRFTDHDKIKKKALIMNQDTNSSKPSSLAIWGAMLAVYVVWGSTYLAIRFAVESMPPFLMAGVRFVTAGMILYGWRRLRGDPAPARIEWRSATVIGLFLLLGGNGGVVWAEQRVASGIAALMVGSAPLWMVLIDALRPGGQRPGWQTLAGVLVGFSGIVLLIDPVNISGSAQKMDTPGVIALLLAGFLWAVGSLYARGARLPASPLLGTGMEMLAGGAGLLLAGTLVGEWSRLDLGGITTNSLLGLGYLIFFGALVGFAAYTWLLRVAPTPLVSTYAYVNPMIAIFLGNLLAREPLTPRILVSALVIVSSVALINTARAKAPQPVQAFTPSPSSGDD